MQFFGFGLYGLMISMASLLPSILANPLANLPDRSNLANILALASLLVK